MKQSDKIFNEKEIHKREYEKFNIFQQIQEIDTEINNLKSRLKTPNNTPPKEISQKSK